MNPNPNGMQTYFACSCCDFEELLKEAAEKPSPTSYWIGRQWYCSADCVTAWHDPSVLDPKQYRYSPQ